MKTKSKSHDIAIRLPESKKYIKARLVKIAEKNGMTVTQLVTLALDSFINDFQDDDFTFKLK